MEIQIYVTCCLSKLTFIRDKCRTYSQHVFELHLNHIFLNDNLNIEFLSCWGSIGRKMLLIYLYNKQNKLFIMTTVAQLNQNDS